MFNYLLFRKKLINVFSYRNHQTLARGPYIYPYLTLGKPCNPQQYSRPPIFAGIPYWNYLKTLKDPKLWYMEGSVPGAPALHLEEGARGSLGQASARCSQEGGNPACPPPVRVLLLVRSARFPPSQEHRLSASYLPACLNHRGLFPRISQFSKATSIIISGTKF